MTAPTTLPLHQSFATRRALCRMLARTALASTVLTAGLFAATPVALEGGAWAFCLFSLGSSVPLGLLLKGRCWLHSLCQFLGCILLCGVQVLLLWDMGPTRNLLLLGAAQAGSLLLALFTQLLYWVFAFFTMLLTLSLGRHED